MTHPPAAALPARFDVVAISGSGGENPPQWIRAAFDCSA
jgi:putative endonuclease